MPRLGLAERDGASLSFSTELQRLKAEAQEKQLQLEERHRQELERLRAHYQQQATDTEERYATELFVLQQRLQEVTGSETYYRWCTAETHILCISVHLSNLFCGDKIAFWVCQSGILDFQVTVFCFNTVSVVKIYCLLLGPTAVQQHKSPTSVS